MATAIVLDDEQKIKVEALASVLTVEQIADYFGISRRSFFNVMERDPEVEMRYRKGRAKVLAKIAGALIKAAIEGDTASRIFYLKTQGGWRETSKVDHTSSDGSMATKPDKIIITALMADDDSANKDPA